VIGAASAVVVSSTIIAAVPTRQDGDSDSDDGC
jgi:hypothetical protein